MRQILLYTLWCLASITGEWAHDPEKGESPTEPGFMGGAASTA